MRNRVLLCVVFLGGLCLGQLLLGRVFAQANRPVRQAIKPAGAAANLPFSEGVLVGETLYVAGHIGTDPKTGIAPADVNQEIKFLLDGIQDTLKQAGMTMDDLVYVQVFCTDLSLYDRFNAAYAAYFKKDFPARMFVGSSQLLRGGHFEIMAIAVKK